jgi:hypothetical protein
MEKSKMQEVLEDAEVGTLRSYSGRGMYGKSCLGLDTDLSLGEIFSRVLDVLRGEEETEEVQRAFENMEQDSLGRGKIIYFPGTPFADEEDEEDGPHDCEGASCCTPV